MTRRTEKETCMLYVSKECTRRIVNTLRVAAARIKTDDPEVAALLEDDADKIEVQAHAY